MDKQTLITFWHEVNKKVFNNSLEFEGISIYNYKNDYARYHPNYGIKINVDSHKHIKNVYGTFLHEIAHQYVEQTYKSKYIEMEKENGYHGTLFLKTCLKIYKHYPQYNLI